MSVRGHSASIGALFLSLFTCFFLFALTQCTTPEASQQAVELGLAATFTSVPFTPEAEDEMTDQLTVPATFTPDGSGYQVGLSTGADYGNLADATATADLSGRSTVIEVRRTSSPTPSAILIPSAVPTAGTASTPTNPPPPATGAPTSTSAPNVTPTNLPATTNTPVPPTNTAAPSTTPVPAANPKKGIGAAYAWAYADGHEPFSPGWYYTWSLFPGLWEGQGPEFVPMWPCHGTVDYVVSTLGSDYDGYLLFLNEPDIEEQCYMSVDEAVDYYLMVRNALPQAKLIGPQTITSTNLNWGAWTNAWREKVRERTGSYPDVAGYGFHVYPFYNSGIPTQQAMQSWCDSLASWGELGSKEIWVTEFGVHNFDGSPQQVQAELTEMVNLFENGLGNCEISRYAYFTDRRAPIGENPTPTIEPGGPNYFDLYWRNSYELSYTGQVYANIANAVSSPDFEPEGTVTEMAAPSPNPHQNDDACH